MSDDTTTLAALVPDPANRRHHPPRNVDMIADALRAVGAARSIVIDEHNEVLAGNGVIEAAAAAGISRLQIVDADGQTLVAVRRSGLTPEQKRELAIYDNRTAELATWDLQQLQADHDVDLDLRPWWTEAEELMLLGTAVEPTWGGMPEFTQPDAMGRALVVRFATPEDFAAFCVLLQRQDLTDKTKSIWFPAAPIESVVGHQAYATQDPPE